MKQNIKKAVLLEGSFFAGEMDFFRSVSFSNHFVFNYK